MEIFIDLGEQVPQLGRVGCVALKDGSVAGAVPVALEVALRAIRPNWLEIPGETVGHDAREQRLERLALLAKEGILEPEPVKTARGLVHCPHPNPIF